MKIEKKRKGISLFLITLAAVFAVLQGCSEVSEVDTFKTEALELAEKSPKIDYNADNGLLYVNNELLVFLDMGAAEQETALFLEQQEAQTDISMADIGIYRLVFPESMGYEELVARAAKLEESSVVEQVHLSTLFEMGTMDEEKAVYPNDPWKKSFWQKVEAWDDTISDGRNWGMEAIDAPEAWAYLDRMSRVKVGMIDSMPDLSHEDLTIAKAWCMKVDENGTFAEVDPKSVSADGHGTHVAGIMAADWDNGKGVSGVMGGKGELYSYTIDEDDVDDSIIYSGYITGYTYLEALKTLLDQDVRVINISQGGAHSGFSASHGNQNAIDYVTRQAELAEEVLGRIIAQRQLENRPDFVICISAGNMNDDSYIKDDEALLGFRNKNKWELFKEYFGAEFSDEVFGNAYAEYSHFLNLIETPEIRDRVIVVGAVKIREKASTATETKYGYTDYSNIGSRVDIVAPGSHVFSCTANGYGHKTGTSMAAPHVSGVAGLIFACNPTLSGPEVKEILLATTTGEYSYSGGSSGMVNAHMAVVAALKTLETTEELPPQDSGETPEEPPKETLPEPTESEPAETLPEPTESKPAETEPGDLRRIYEDFLASGGYVDYIVDPEIRDVCRMRVVDNYYVIRDLDFNGVEDLLLWLGYTGADGEILTFTLNNDSVRYTGSAACDGTGTSVFCSDHDDDFIFASYDGWGVYAQSYKFINGMLTLMQDDTVIPHRWYEVEPTGTLPNKNGDTPAAPENGAMAYDAFVNNQSYIHFLENQKIFDSWMAGTATSREWVADVDRDGIDELIVWMGCGGSNGEVLVFTGGEGSLEYLGSISGVSGTAVGICTNETAAGFLIVFHDGMLESMTKCEILGATLITTENYMLMEDGWYALESLR